jgi:hypothetical protein
MQKAFTPFKWKNAPSEDTPLNEDDLNIINNAVDTIDDRVVSLYGYEEIVQQYASDANTSMVNSEFNANMAKSYAIGEGGMRNDESTNNAMYYNEQAASNADTARINKEEATKQANNASTYASNASASATNAAKSENESSDSATLSRSYAMGGTGTRTGEDEDNAQYYSNQSQQYAQDAKTSAAAIANVLYADEDGYLCIGDEEGE